MLNLRSLVSNVWKPTLRVDAELDVEITLKNCWKPEDRETGLYLTFEYSPNLGLIRTPVYKKAWKRALLAYIYRICAEMTGLNQKDFFKVAFDVGPSVTVGTAKDPKKKVQAS